MSPVPSANKQGKLKVAKQGKSYKKRWVILFGKNLLWYKSKRDELPVGALTLDQADIVMTNGIVEVHTPVAFTYDSTGERKTLNQISFDFKGEDLEAWYVMLKSFASGVKQQQQESSGAIDFL